VDMGRENQCRDAGKISAIREQFLMSILKTNFAAALCPFPPVSWGHQLELPTEWRTQKKKCLFNIERRPHSKALSV